MSQGILGKDGNGWAKADVATSRTLANSFKAVVATHKSVGGETAINLLSLTSAAGDLPGFVQPNASEIQAARPYMMPGTFRLMSSARGRLTMYAHFVLTGNQISFTTAFGSTLVNEIFWIEILPVPANNLLVSDGRQFDTGPFEQAVGAATVNVGYSFTASDFIVVIRNNQILDEFIDFTRVIGSTGTGSTLTLTSAPAGTNDNMRIYGGIFFGNASVELFTQIERLQSALQLLALDVSVGLYGDTNAARYLSAAPAEIDRMAFGARVAALETAKIVLAANNTSAQALPNSTNTQINNWTKRFDPSNLMNATTGTITANRDMKILAIYSLAASGFTANTDGLTLDLTQSGSTSYTSETKFAFNNNNTVNQCPMIVDFFDMKSGDLLTPFASHASGGTINLQNVAGRNRLTLLQLT